MLHCKLFHYFYVISLICIISPQFVILQGYVVYYLGPLPNQLAAVELG